MTSLAHTQHAGRQQQQRTTTSASAGFWPAVRRAVTRAFNRLVNAVYVSRSNRAQREIAQHFASHGVPLTDAMEREIGERFMTGGWSRR